MLSITEKQLKGMAKHSLSLLKSKPQNEIKYSHLLESFSHALGYRDYNSLVAVIKETNDPNESEPFEDFVKKHSITLEDIRGKKEAEYPSSVNENFVKLETHYAFEVFIHLEVSGSGNDYYTLFRMNKNYTQRVFYTPKYDKFCLFVYPDVKEAYNDYAIGLSEAYGSNAQEMTLNLLGHVNSKSWMTRELMNDFIKTIEWVLQVKSQLETIDIKYTKEQLRQIYLLEKPEVEE